MSIESRGNQHYLTISIIITNTITITITSDESRPQSRGRFGGSEHTPR
jgi:hypothetical protein